MINYFADLNYKTQLLLFPEGTDLSQQNKDKSNEFAKKNGLPLYDYVLHPRTAGFTLVAQQMRQSKSIKVDQMMFRRG